MAEVQVQDEFSNSMLSDNNTDDYVTFYLQDQMFGIPILQVQDILLPQATTAIPLSAKEIIGALNLRGRIVTAIDVRTALGLETSSDEEKAKEMSTVVEYQNELYSLRIDRVGDVMGLPKSSYEKSPPTLDSIWREISAGVYRMPDKLIIVLDVAKLIGRLTQSNPNNLLDA